MPVQAAQWTEFLSCPICYNEFDACSHKPISLGCSHTVCKTCLHKLHRKACPFDQTAISTDIDVLPVNCALLQLVGAPVPEGEIVSVGSVEDTRHYEVCRICVEELALYLKPISGGKGVVTLSQSTLSRPMQRKLVTLVNCQLVEEEGRMRAVRACRSLGERTVTELILQHQNPQQLSANLWAAVRARGCQFLGPGEFLCIIFVECLWNFLSILNAFVLPLPQLQSPESFAKSVQELTIILQRTGDPTNLNSLRAPLELLAGIDHNPDAAAPSWTELESVLLAVKVVVHGLVEFIQNFSKKSNESPQAQPNSKYKTSMCRDLRQQGGCPRGASCTFAHTQEELEKHRMRSRKASGAVRPFSSVPVVMPKTGTKGAVPGSEGKNHENDAPEDASPTQLIPRGGDHQEDKTLPSSSQSSAIASGLCTEDDCGLLKHGPVLTRAHPKIYYSQDQRPYDLSPYHQPAIPPHKSCNARFHRSSNVSESMLPPSMGPQYPDQHPSVPPADRLGPGPYGPPSTYASMSHAHSMYTPVYDSRRVWRPPLYPRDGGRSNSLPPEVFHSTVYQPPLRERFNSLDSPYCSTAEQRAPMHRDAYTRVPLGYEELYRHKQEQWVHHHGNMNRPSQSSPVFTVDVCPEGVGGRRMTCKCHGGEESLAHYSPWSCSTISPFESEPHHLSTHSCSKQLDGESGGKRWLHMFEPYRRLKDEDPIIPFGEGPIISKWGAISRASRTGFHTTDPFQATASQGCNSYSQCVSVCFSDQLAMSGLHVRHNSFRSGSKQGTDLLDKDGMESEPDRDIELELSALDMEDTESQDCNSENSQLSTVFGDPATSSQLENNLPDRMDAHLMKKMAFR
uniref:Roquin-2-like n=1 Tax=Sinocyclocheilus rhinocerous TaxID=307959 RepID=A0A673NIX6_9TELE